MTKDSLDLSYAAGLFDGEGTVTLARRHRGKREFESRFFKYTRKKVGDGIQRQR